jgi:hypothetical protein
VYDNGRLTDKFGSFLISVLVEELNHWRDHCEVKEEEESDASVLPIRSESRKVGEWKKTYLVTPLVKPLLERQV